MTPKSVSKRSVFHVLLGCCRLMPRKPEDIQRELAAGRVGRGAMRRPMRAGASLPSSAVIL